ncbi:MAG: hypothetical protein Q8R40_00970 [bacterium]|nr:hypothetical protein [bacterium]
MKGELFVKKILHVSAAIFLMLLGLASPLIPFFPFGFLFFVGLGMLGIHIVPFEKISAWLWRQKWVRLRKQQK